MGRLYIANDVESAGGKLGIHSTLSFGAAVITAEKITFADYWERGLVFYTELRPDPSAYDLEAMNVSCSQLICLEEVKLKDPQFDSTSPQFDPTEVLRLMENNCEEPLSAMKRFNSWIKNIRNGEEKIVGVTDAVFFGGSRIDLCFGLFYQGKSPYGWSGLDLDSVYRGYVRDAQASLKNLGVPDERKKPHRADHDAVSLAQVARVLLFEKMGWPSSV